MVTGGNDSKYKSSKSAVNGRKQLSLVDFILSALRKSMVSACSVDRQDQEMISAVHRMEIGWPTNVKHVTHVTFDRFHGFLGLPLEFEIEIPCRAPSARYGGKKNGKKGVFSLSHTNVCMCVLYLFPPFGCSLMLKEVKMLGLLS